jgi:F0F1-type ATP synthase assembly protein I
MVNDPEKDSVFLSYTRGMRTVGPLFTAGIQIAAAVGLMGFFGYALDHLWNTTPWLMVVGIFFGAAAGMYLFIKTVDKVNRSEQEKQQSK